MCTNLWLLSTIRHRTGTWKMLVAKFLPVLKPSTAFTNISTCPIDIFNLHDLLLNIIKYSVS